MENEIAFKVVNDALNIILAHLRVEIKSQMRDTGDINGFVLLALLNQIGNELKIDVKRSLIARLIRD